MPDLTIEDIHVMSEDVELEVKKALGRDGKGKLPNGFFETYSAMANTSGGSILLGIEEKPKGKFRAIGIPDPAPLLKSICDELNNKDQVNVNLLQDKDINVIEVEGKKIVRVDIPRAPRTHRPIHTGRNPITGTFRRLNESNYPCDETTVFRMLAEKVEEARDARVLSTFNTDDIHPETFMAYRRQFKLLKPDHPWNDLDKFEFLEMIGGWGRNRETGEEGLTIAGLLMFGWLISIQEEIPNYFLDYQERPEPKTELRWIDRITTDGTWSGNIYDFYKKVINKLFAGLKVPFIIKGDLRSEETTIHESLREALVNTLIHADYSCPVSILVVKRPDMFGFRNPGNMRIPIEDAINGGVSDCRNRKLQQMFRLIGLGEQAGSGLPKIYVNWQKQHWMTPDLSEETNPEQTLLKLKMIDLIPDAVVERLDERFGVRFRSLPEEQRLALVFALTEGTVTHSRLKNVTATHPHDLTMAFRELVKGGFLESNGTGRGTYYYLPGERLSKEMDLFTSPMDIGHGRINSENSGHSSVHSSSSSVHSDPRSVYLEGLKSRSTEVRDKKKAPRNVVVNSILKICQGDFLSLKEIAEILNRTSDTLRIHYLAPLIREGKLELLHPDKVNHPNQRYRTVAPE